ncbi:MAG: hypothetical protein E3J72_04265 [Planctomycetota bacterium]|nr:MAG: hypothetical protein E3J72_04265 [Planctomycetota bacterium]
MFSPGRVLIFLLVLLGGCAPGTAIVLDLPEDTWKAFDEPIDIAVKMGKFRYENKVQESFETNASYSDLVFEEPLSDQITKAFNRYLEKSGIFREIVDDTSDADAVVFGRIIRSQWGETGSIWTPILLSIFTVDLYPLLGGPLSWPAAEVRLEVVVKHPSRKTCFRIYSGAGYNKQSLSLYSLSKSSPATQLSLAINDAILQIGNGINKDRENLLELFKPLPSKKEEKQEKKQEPLDIPGITIIQPSRERNLVYRSILLKVKFEGKTPLAGYSVELNRAPVASGRLSGTTHLLEKRIVLSSGRNTLIITLVNKKGGKRKKQCIINCDRVTLLNPRRWVLIVSPLDSGDSDENPVKRFVNTLKKHEDGGFSEKRVLWLNGKNATRSNILAAIRNLTPKAGKRDEVFLFFIGHGFSLSSRPEDNFLYCAGTSVKNPDTTAISVAVLQDALRFYMACPRYYGQYLFTRSGSSVSPINLKSVKETMAKLPAWGTVAAAVRAFGKDDEHSSWGDMLLSACSAKADADKNAILDLGEMISYLQQAAGGKAKFEVAVSGWKLSKLFVLDEEPGK